MTSKATESLEEFRCPASYEAVEEAVEAGDTGCPLCGERPEEHDHE